jgi:ABC-2 type transport system permease protein
MSIFITSGYLLQSVTEEKENRVVEILLSSVPSLPLMAGKILGLGAAGLTQVAIWVAATLLAIPLISAQVGGLGDISLDPAVVLLALVYFVLGYLAYGAIFAAIGAIAPGNREAQQYSGFFGFLAVIPLIFSSAFLGGDVSSPLVWALALFPITTPATMLLVLAVSPTIPMPMVVASLVTLGLFTVLATIASARVFRATLLLYGVRPSIGRIVGAIVARD